jgi:hypothetical protein
MMVIVPLGAQALLMLVDEFIFHRRRGLPRWERWGHPIDTLSVGLALAVPAFAPPTIDWLTVYIGLSIFSCLLVTKDEWVHAKACAPMEHWLHAMLFVLHPVVFGVLAWAWWSEFQNFPRFLLWVELATLFGFAVYQILYWVPRGRD